MSKDGGAHYSTTAPFHSLLGRNKHNFDEKTNSTSAIKPLNHKVVRKIIALEAHLIGVPLRMLLRGSHLSPSAYRCICLHTPPYTLHELVGSLKIAKRSASFNHTASHSLASSLTVPIFSFGPYFSSTFFPWYFQNCFVESFPAMRFRILEPPGCSSMNSRERDYS